MNKLLLIISVFLVLFMVGTASAFTPNWGAAVRAGAEEMARQTALMAEMERQKELMRYQYELDVQRQQKMDEARQQEKAREREEERKAREHEEEHNTKYTESSQGNPNWKAIARSTEFKQWLKDNPSEKSLFGTKSETDKAMVMEAYGNYLKSRQESADRALAEKRKLKDKREAAQLLTHRDDQVSKAYPDWNNIKNDPDFFEWLTIQPSQARDIVISNDATEIIKVVKNYKETPPLTLREIGRVKSLVIEYGYLIFTLNDPGYKKIDDVIFLENGKKIKRSTEKRNGADVSIIVNNFGSIKKDDIVYVYQ